MRGGTLDEEIPGKSLDFPPTPELFELAVDLGPSNLGVGTEGVGAESSTMLIVILGLLESVTLGAELSIGLSSSSSGKLITGIVAAGCDTIRWATAFVTGGGLNGRPGREGNGLELADGME